MRRPYFVADAASVTVLHSVASSAFGKYSLTVTDGVNIDDVYKLSAPGNELGYVAQLAPAGTRVGGFARRFVRADVSVRSIGESNDDTWTAASDVDTTLTEAARRVQGDFFLESDITLAGLGPWIPFEHFDVGDIADVEIWGRVVPLPVTRIEPNVSDHSIVDWRIHVGGQLVSDEEARLAENDVVRRAVVDSRRDLAGIAETASKAVETASTAVATANAANSKSDEALKAATDADGTLESKLAEYRRLVAKFDADVVVNSQAADDMRQAAESYASSVAAAKVDTERYASLVADSKLIQSAVESAAADARQASGEVSSLINAPDGEFRKGVAKFTEFQTMVNDKQSAWNVGIQKTLDAQSDVNTKQRQVNEVQADVNNKQQLVNQSQQQVNATQANINRQQGEINDALKQATTAATNAAADAVKTSNAVSASTRISNAQQDSAIKLAQNSAYLQRQTAVQVVMTRNGRIIPNDYIDGALSKESWGIGGTRLSKFTFTAKGDWAGSLAIQIITSSGDVDYKNYGVGPGARGASFSTEGPVDIEGLFISIQIYYGNSPRKFALVADSGRRLKIGSVIMAAFESPGGLYANLLEGDPVDWRSGGHVRFPGLAVKPDAAVYCLSADSQSVTRVEPGSVIPAGTSILAAQDPDGLKRVVEFST